MDTQNVINICLTICVALLVYQNQQLKDQVKNVSFERIETINTLSAQIDKVKADLLSDYGTQAQDNALLDLKKLVTSCLLYTSPSPRD